MGQAQQKEKFAAIRQRHEFLVAPDADTYLSVLVLWRTILLIASHGITAPSSCSHRIAFGEERREQGLPGGLHLPRSGGLPSRRLSGFHRESLPQGLCQGKGRRPPYEICISYVTRNPTDMAYPVDAKESEETFCRVSTRPRFLSSGASFRIRLPIYHNPGRLST